MAIVETPMSSSAGLAKVQAAIAKLFNLIEKLRNQGEIAPSPT